MRLHTGAPERAGPDRVRALDTSASSASRASSASSHLHTQATDQLRSSPAPGGASPAIDSALATCGRISTCREHRTHAAHLDNSQ